MSCSVEDAKTVVYYTERIVSDLILVSLMAGALTVDALYDAYRVMAIAIAKNMLVMQFHSDIQITQLQALVSHTIYQCCTTLYCRKVLTESAAVTDYNVFCIICTMNGYRCSNCLVNGLCCDCTLQVNDVTSIVNAKFNELKVIDKVHRVEDTRYTSFILL
jgi:hypothetical protein